MFTNFIYLIIALLIYTTYQPAETTNFTFLESAALFILLSCVFFFYTYKRFKKLEKDIESGTINHADRRFNTALTRLPTLAIILFAFHIYALNLPSFLYGLFLFSSVPTLLAILFLVIFIFHLVVIWYFAYPCYEKIYPYEFSRKSYVFSQVNFSVPLLLPWVLLSGVADIIHILPFRFPKEFLSTTQGQLTYFLSFLFIIAVFGPVIIQKFWKCEPLEENERRKRIEELCKRADLNFSDILKWPVLGGRMINAAVMGLIGRFRYILVTKALFRYLDDDEINSVIAHEIGHAKKYHLVFYLLFFSGFLLYSYSTFNLFVFLSIYIDSFFGRLAEFGSGETAVTSTIMTLFLIINFIIYFRYIFGFFMRNFERQADTYVYTLFNSARPLMSTLNKIAVTTGQSPDKPNWHHFSINERIGYLNKCESDRRWIKRHDGKIRMCIVVFCLSLSLVGFLGYMLNFGTTGKALTADLMETVLEREIRDNPNDPNLYIALGDVYYQQNKYPEAIQAYEKSLSISRDNSHALNNLAWLLATCEEIKYRNPERALELALKAVHIEKAPHILDTLAESYYVNGNYKEAIETEKEALKSAQSDRTHYKNQLKKFQAALLNSE